MDVQKWSCFLVGALMILVAVKGGPMGGSIAISTSIAARDATGALISDGSLTVNTDTTLTNHPVAGAGSGTREGDAKEAIAAVIAQSVSGAVLRDTHGIEYGVLVMGLM